MNVSSFRLIIGFAMSFRATTWVEQRGFLGSFGIYAGVLGFLSLLLPLLWVFGKRLRQWTAGTVEGKTRARDVDTEMKSLDTARSY